MTDTGRRVGPVVAPHPISGSPRVLEEQRRKQSIFSTAAKNGWERSMFLGWPRLEKDGRIVVDVDEVGGYVFSDAVDGVLVHCWAPQLRAVLRGTRCECRHRATDGGSRATHESTCPLAEVA